MTARVPSKRGADYQPAPTSQVDIDVPRAYVAAPQPHARYWPTVTLADTEWESLLDALEGWDVGELPLKQVRVKVAEQVYAARNAKRSSLVASEVSGPGDS